MAPAVARPQALSKRRASVLRAVGCVALAAWGCGVSHLFVLSPSPSAASRAAAVARCASEEGSVAVEAPPSDAELGGIASSAPRVRKFLPKREIPGTVSHYRMHMNDEAARFQTIIEPLIFEKQISLKELTFVLNRIGHKIRHLLFRPRNGLPIFTAHKVNRLCSRAKSKMDSRGLRLHKYLRPQDLPPFAIAACPRPHKHLKDVMAEVPPLQPLSEETKALWAEVLAEDPMIERWPAKKDNVLHLIRFRGDDTSGEPVDEEAEIDAAYQKMVNVKKEREGFFKQNRANAKFVEPVEVFG